MKKLRMKYVVESYNYTFYTLNLISALFKFFKYTNKGRSCRLTSFMVEE